MVELPWEGYVTNETTQPDIKYFLLIHSMNQQTELSSAGKNNKHELIKLGCLNLIKNSLKKMLNIKGF